MESLAPYVPLIVITAIIVIVVRWRKSVRYLKQGGAEHLKNHGIVSAKPKPRTGKGADSRVSGDWVPMSMYKEKVVGVTKSNSDGSSRQKIISSMSEGDKVFLIRDPENPYGSNAIEVWDSKKRQVGFIEKFRSDELAPQIDKGYKVEAWVDKIMGGDSGRNFGVLISIQRYKPSKSG